MKSYVLVLKTVLLNNFRAVRTRYVRIDDKKQNAKNKLSNATNAALALLGIAVIIVLMSIMTHALAFLSALEGLHVKLLSTMLTCVQITVLILGFSGVTSNMFFSKDNEFLSSLPVRPEAVFSAKLTVVYLNDLIVGSVFLIPLLVSYVVGVIQGGATLPLYFYFMIPVIALTIPVVPLAIISVLSFPMVKIVSYFKNKAIVTLVLSVVMFLGFFAIYMVFVRYIDKFVGSGAAKVLPKALADMIIAIDNVVFYNRFFALALTGTRFFGNVLIYLAVVCLSVGVVTGLAAVLYKKAAGKSGEETRRKSSAKNDVLVLSGKKKALFLREIKCLFRNQSFAFNSVMGSVVTPLIVVVMYFIGLKSPTEQTGQALSSLANGFSNVGVTFFYSLMLLCGMNYTASLAISREGSTFCVLRYIPVDFSEILKTKIKVANLVSYVGVVLVCAASLGVTKGDVANVLPMTLALFVYAYAFNSICVFRDLKKPNVSWTSPYEVIKRNIYPMVPMFYAMGLGIAFMVIMSVIAKYESAINIKLGVSLFWIGTIVIGVVIAVVVNVTMKKKAQFFFDRINVN